jgi:hypothetical protein
MTARILVSKQPTTVLLTDPVWKALQVRDVGHVSANPR